MSVRFLWIFIPEVCERVTWGDWDIFLLKPLPKNQKWRELFRSSLFQTCAALLICGNGPHFQIHSSQNMNTMYNSIIWEWMFVWGSSHCLPIRWITRDVPSICNLQFTSDCCQFVTLGIALLLWKYVCLAMHFRGSGCIFPCAMYWTLYTVYTVYTLYTVHCTVYTLYTLYTVYTVHCVECAAIKAV